MIALTALLMAAVAFWRESPIWFIYLVLCIRSAGAAFHSPSLNAMIPTIVPSDQLTRCAGFLQSFESVSMILSPALAAVLFSLWDLSAIVLLDVAGAAVAILIVLAIKIPRNTVERSNRLSVWRDTKEGIVLLRREKGMMAILVISLLYALIYFPIGSMYPLITMTWFGGTVADSSLVEIMFSGGTLVGALLLGWIGNKIHKVISIALSIGVYGVGAALVGLLPPPHQMGLFVLLSAGMGVTVPFFYGLCTAIFQNRIPGKYWGRVLSLAYSVSLFAAPLGLLFGCGFSEMAGVQNCFFICGVLVVCLGLAMLITPSIRNSCDKTR